MGPNKTHWYDYIVLLVLLGITGFFVVNVIIGIASARNDESGLATVALIFYMPIALALLYASYNAVSKMFRKR